MFEFHPGHEGLMALSDTFVWEWGQVDHNQSGSKRKRPRLAKSCGCSNFRAASCVGHGIGDATGGATSDATSDISGSRRSVMQPVMQPVMSLFPGGGALKKFDVGALDNHPCSVILECVRWYHRVT